MNREQPDSGQSVLQGQASAEQLEKAKIEKALLNRDLVILIDRSGSMETTDCPGAMSRWQWCREQLAALSRDTQKLLPDGFELVLFNNHTKVYESANIEKIVEAFDTNKPDGGTDISGAITKVLHEYRDRKSLGKAHPLVMAIITDGEPNDERALRHVLIGAASDITTAAEISIVFLQVGEDDQAAAYLEDLDHGLIKDGARFDITQSLTFPELKEKGLLKSLVGCVN